MKTHSFSIIAPYAVEETAKLLMPFNKTKREGIEILYDDFGVTIKMSLLYGCVRNIIHNYRQFVKATPANWRWLDE